MRNLDIAMNEESAVYKAIRSSRLYEQIVEQIEGAIMKGKLKPGNQLPAERELAEQFGVSRTAVREAIKALREKGLVEAFSGRGTFITNGTAQVIRQSLDFITKLGRPDALVQLAEVRGILEPGIASLAAGRIESQQIKSLRESVAIMDRSLQDPIGYIEADLDFHLTLAEAADNPLILSLIDSIVGLLREQRLRIFNVDGGPQRGQYHHKRILEAIERHDPAQARSAMQEHLQQVREDSQVSIVEEPGMSKPVS